MTSPKPTVTFLLDIPAKEIRARRPRVSGTFSIVGLLTGMGIIAKGEDVELAIEVVPPLVPDIAGAITELRRILRVGKAHASTRYDRVDAIEKVIRMLEGEHSAERTDDQ